METKQVVGLMVKNIFLSETLKKLGLASIVPDLWAEKG